MDITRDCFSSFVMLYQAFTATDAVVVCLWVFLPLALSSTHGMQLNRAEIRTLTWPWKNLQFFFTFKICFGSLSICTMKRHPINFGQFGGIWADSIPIHFRIHLVASVLCHVITKHQ